MRVIIFGAGAMGSFIGALLQTSGHEVGLLGRSHHLQAIKKAGLVLEDHLSDTTLTVHFSALATSLPELLEKLPNPDWIIITTKAWANENVSMTLRAEMHRLKMMEDANGTMLCLFQNGMGNELPFLKALKIQTIFRGVTAHGCHLKSPGHVSHVGMGFSKLGLINRHGIESLETEPEENMDQVIEKGKLLCRMLTRAGMPCDWEDDLLPSLYMKLAVNCVINSLTAVFEVPNGELVKNEFVLSIFEQVLDEVSSMVHLLCPKLSRSQIIDSVLEVVEKTAMNYSSTLQDLMSGRRTEIDYLCGYLLSRAREKRIPLPHVSMLMAIIKFKEERHVNRAIATR